jgi:hypothetical protein
LVSVIKTMNLAVMICAFGGLFLPFTSDRSAGSHAEKQNSAVAGAEVAGPTLAVQETDAYQIYSALLQTEVPWNVQTWRIKLVTERGPLPMCVQPPADQETIYRPLIEDFQRKNESRFLVKRQFDLPVYELVRPVDGLLVRDGEVLFAVSAVGFNQAHSRALVYIEHHCGSLCGRGAYHLMVKEKGKWTVDHGFRGAPSCLWVS